MKTLTFAQVKTNFEQAIYIVKAGETLTITQDDQPTAVMFSFKEGTELLRLRHTAGVDDYLAARSENAAHVAPELSMDDINKLIKELRL